MNMNNDKAETSYSVLNDPSLSGIPQEKIVFLEKMLFEAKTKSQSELLPFFLNLVQFSKANHIDFSPEETDAIIQVLQKNSSSRDLKNMEYILGVFKKMSGKK